MPQLNPAFVVVTGGPIDGITLHGPFNSYDEAADWADRVWHTDSWWITAMQPASVKV